MGRRTSIQATWCGIKSGKVEQFWPAIVIDPMTQAPELVLHSCIPDSACVVFFGHSENENERNVFDFIGKERDFLLKDTAEKEIATAVTAAKKRLREAEKKKEEEEESLKPLEKKLKEESVPMEVEKPKEEEEQKAGPIVPNKGNGLDFDNYSWTQNLQEVTITDSPFQHLAALNHGPLPVRSRRTV
ncbi:unnamed protein product [Eruca vesicaria subsp. sativa]|uniref:PWWP domain-containing protein n=1 Tax=Eruca vesicaria subsp. sativa TaxID=29727 RepID=A0ABC8K4F0_ERUVS|nr:unnamed protein product [Eruca vesicaria subsp. sativa]